MDQFDRASELEQKQIEISIQAALKQPEIILPTGKCLNCKEPVDDNRRWCDFDCMNDWERDRKKKNISIC